MEKMKKKIRVFKGINLDSNIVEFIEEERKKEHRSFSAQIGYIIDEWLKKKLPK